MRNRSVVLTAVPVLALLTAVDMAQAYFKPGLGRFISRDPIEEREGRANLYAYALNSPINVCDPVGQAPFSFLARNPVILAADADGPATQPGHKPGEAWGTCRDCKAACANAPGATYGLAQCENNSPCYCVCGDREHIRTGPEGSHDGLRKANDIIEGCVQAHELVHVGATTCRGNNPEPVSPGRNSECDADLAGANCIAAAMQQCDDLKTKNEKCRCYRRLRFYVNDYASGVKDKPEDPDCPDTKKCQEKQKEVLKGIDTVLKERGCD